MENKGEIYLITCNWTGKKYVGQAVCLIKCKNGTFRKHGMEGRWKIHVWCALAGKDRCNVLCNAIRKYGVDNFSIKPLVICDVSMLNYYEHKMARHYNAYSPGGYNIRQCSSKGRHSTETKEKISAKKKGENNHMYGKHHSKQTKAKISSANTGKVRDAKVKAVLKSIKTKHTGLPQYVYYCQSHGAEGYRVMKHPTLKERKFVATSLTMEAKLAEAVQYIATGVIPVHKSSYDHDDEWKNNVRETRQISNNLPQYIYMTNNNKRGTHGYQVRNHPNLKNKQFVSKSLSMQDKLALAEQYINSKEESSEDI
jgi:group I intron endonuclease